MSALRAITNLSRLTISHPPGDGLFLFASTAAKKTPAKTKLPPLGFFVNPYAIFVKENYKSVDKGDVMSTGKLLSQQWSKLDDAEKKKYFDQAAKHREEKVKEFEKLPEAKKQQLIEEAQQKKEKRAETSEKIAKHKMWKETGRPTPPPTARNLYIKEEFGKLKASGTALNRQNVSGYLVQFSNQWKTLADFEKKRFETESTRLHEDYKKEHDEWKTKVTELKKEEKKEAMAKKEERKETRKTNTVKTTKKKAPAKK
ncbi:hypothetical protein WR25_13291 isoform A [Diploscapter pachys]|uniref:HMG box domain-containing protein n=1 Tax=Diploscapter pachys TaxID=2018661 RepID=A0A2A2JRQ0_9BILA|nr:hypothetical protein WR25_13291 isoform A [Diploscapter pachys]